MLGYLIVIRQVPNFASNKIDFHFIQGSIYDVDPAVIKLFNKELSSEEYNEWVVHNNYSKQISPIYQAARDRRAYELTAYGDYKDPNQGRKSVFFARVKELNNETWPLFQHFVRLITDPFIRIRYLRLIPQADVLKLLASTIEHNNRGRLQCEKLNFNFEGNVQESFNWIKDHMRCANFEIAGFRSSPDHDKQLLDFFATGSHCTSEIFVTFDRISKAVIVDFVQKFMDLKSRDDIQLVESIRGGISDTTVKALKSIYAKFFIKEEKPIVFEIVNADIGKKMRLTVSGPASRQVTLKIINL
ncbi:hypothetical protein DdX_17553 [Ditylenchus destructor]|uniref:Uncharacterized protein n=1 Tax=Ditylenchus destructor TaxID=166010 RepID=A0AAD4MR66_9BILA|nr:hypothetical protein DdX_17553 [Ditylenchus destructor]